jgi:hypothetical protein
MFAILTGLVIFSYLKHEKNRIFNYLLLSTPALIMLIIIIYLNVFVFSSPILGYSTRFSSGFEELALLNRFESIQNMLGFLFFSYLPLLPLIFFGLKNYREKLHINAWILWTFIPLILVVIDPAFFLGGVLPYRWILLLIYPLSFYAVEGLFKIKWAWLQVIYKVLICSVIAFLSVSFIALPNSNALDYFEAYPTYVPKSMLQNTLQLSDCTDTVNALHWAKDNLPFDGHLLVHQAFLGWGLLEFDGNRLIPYSFENPSKAAENFRNTSSNPLFLIWWVNGTGWYGNPDTPAPFASLFKSGNIAIYNYTIIELK